MQISGSGSSGNKPKTSSMRSVCTGGSKVASLVENDSGWVSGRDYVQTETGLDEETFHGRYQVSSSDLEPITWANYKDFLPSDAVPVALYSTLVCCKPGEMRLTHYSECVTYTSCASTSSSCANPSTTNSVSSLAKQRQPTRRRKQQAQPQHLQRWRKRPSAWALDQQHKALLPWPRARLQRCVFTPCRELSKHSRTSRVFAPVRTS